ncbi:hypothetical protein OIDMADRAFT_167357 [Oidiodendron maius Zn]|uniref:NB-ARC domain-containing protein n=1 Tax=Oidiodendron maius (strain Zn) TaxID=913774 RepID=A0A0C3H830_OIDMZ|nr:hypothetical protein OIDMADRAFT_167357 [Oidiodendron maius Zn]
MSSDVQDTVLAIRESTEVINAGGDSIVSRNGYNSWGQLPGPATNDLELNSSANSLTPSAWIVPFARNRDFVGREEILERLLKIILPSADKDVCQRTAIEGPGGVGKTQIALEAAFRIRDQHPDRSVFWVSAVDAMSFENAFREIGRQLQVKEIDRDEADAKLLVKNALSQSATSWLLIIDNADDLQVFGNADAMPSSDYLPFSPTGSILFTTRNHKAIVGLDIPPSNVIAVREMGRDEAIKLLQRNLEKSQIGDAEITSRLLDFLADLPLAIKQASAYMAKTGISNARYLEHCQSSDKNLVALLSKEFEDQHDHKHQNMKNPLVTTWLLSFQQISQENKLAAQYLQFMCFLAEKDIPASLLPPADDELDKEGVIKVLKAYAFINERIGSSSFDIHHLVRLPTRNWLETEREVEMCATSVLQRLADVFPWPEYENQGLWMRYLPHVLTVLGGRKDAGDEKDVRDLLHRVGRSLFLLGRHNDAIQIYWQEVKLKEKILGIEHPSTLSGINNLALMLQSQEKYKEAEAMLRKVLRFREKVLGIEHPDALTSMENLANILYWQGKFEDAETMYRQMLELMEKILGIEHPDTLTSMNYLAHALCAQEKYKEAEAMHRQTLRLREKVLGIEQLDTINSRSNLASVLHTRGKYEEAEAMYRQTLKLMEKVQGTEHPDILISMNNLALVLYEQGKHKEAETMHRQTHALGEKVLGTTHPSTLKNMGSLALVLYSQGKYEEAEIMYRRTLKLMEKVLGTEHPDTLISMSNLARVLDKQERYEEAEAMDRQTLKLRERMLGIQHSDTLGSMINLATALHRQGKNEESEAVVQQTLRLVEKVLGTEHPKTLISMNNLAVLLYTQGRYVEAEAMNRRTLKLREKVLGIEHPDTRTSIDSLALVLLARGKYEEAEVIYRKAFRFREKVLGIEHPDTLSSMGNLANVLERQGKYEDAEAMHRQMLELMEKILGVEHPSTQRRRSNLADCLKAKDE